jgi:hypothetical protein
MSLEIAAGAAMDLRHGSENSSIILFMNNQSFIHSIVQSFNQSFIRSMIHSFIHFLFLFLLFFYSPSLWAQCNGFPSWLPCSLPFQPSTACWHIRCGASAESAPGFVRKTAPRTRPLKDFFQFFFLFTSQARLAQMMKGSGRT